MWYPTDCPILESVFVSVAPDAADLSEVFGQYPRHAYSYAELADTTAEGEVF